jgi:hypothetical protein
MRYDQKKSVFVMIFFVSLFLLSFIPTVTLAANGDGIINNQQASFFNHQFF